MLWALKETVPVDFLSGDAGDGANGDVASVLSLLADQGTSDCVKISARHT